MGRLFGPAGVSDAGLGGQGVAREIHGGGLAAAVSQPKLSALKPPTRIARLAKIGGFAALTAPQNSGSPWPAAVFVRGGKCRAAWVIHRRFLWFGAS